MKAHPRRSIPVGTTSETLRQYDAFPGELLVRILLSKLTKECLQAFYETND